MALNPRGQWLALMEARRPLYEAAAALRIDTSGRTADEVLEEIVAALAAGADGIMVEVHPNPDRALSDGAQTLYSTQFDELVPQLRLIAQAIGRTVASLPARAACAATASALACTWARS